MRIALRMSALPHIHIIAGGACPSERAMDLHHVHVFARKIEATIEWWSRHLRAKVFFDAKLAGARNVFLAVGTGRLHIYDQASIDRGRGAIHHLGIKVTDLRGVWQRLQAEGLTSHHGNQLRYHCQAAWRIY